MTEEHPWPPCIPGNSRALFIGTFPPLRERWSFDFFYPNKNNYFWRILSTITGRNLNHFSGEKAVIERQKLLAAASCGITDMGRVIKRDAFSSNDNDLIIVEFTDILGILSENEQIKRLVFTSSSGRSSAAGWFQEYLSKQNIDFRFPKGRKPLYSEITLSGRKIDIVVVHSPSGRAANQLPFNSLVQMYRNAVKYDQ